MNFLLDAEHEICKIRPLDRYGRFAHCLARAIADVGFYEFRRQLGYKCQWYGSRLHVVARTFPSSKRCSSCGHKKKELSLSEREYECEECGLRLDRDLNAALNLVTVSLPETLNARGEDVRLPVISSEMTKKQTSVKQESKWTDGPSCPILS